MVWFVICINLMLLCGSLSWSDCFKKCYSFIDCLSLSLSCILSSFSPPTPYSCVSSFSSHWLTGKSEWEETPESHTQSLPAGNHPIWQCLNPADRKHIHIQVSLSRSLSLYLDITVYFRQSLGRPQLIWNTLGLCEAAEPVVGRQAASVCYYIP